MTIGRGSSAPLNGILCMVAGGALMTTNDAMLKWLKGVYPVGKSRFYVVGLY